MKHIILIIALPVFLSCNTYKKTSGLVVEKASQTPHFILEDENGNFKVVLTTVAVWDTLSLRTYLEFKCKTKHYKLPCLTYIP